MVKEIEQKKKRLAKIVKILRKNYPGSQCALVHQNPLQLAISTILSAQCTDERVNKVTPSLFKKYPDVKSFAEADIRELEERIHSTGFYKNKARSIRNLCRELLLKRRGELPRTLEELVQLPGFGRKTANVVLGVAFGVPGIVVDTHVKRLTNRMGLTREQDPVKIEFEMMDLLPKKDWTDLGLLFIAHGRAICEARKPACEDCSVNSLCPKKGVCPAMPAALNGRAQTLKNR